MVLVTGIVGALALMAPAWACTTGTHTGTPWLCPVTNSTCGVFASQSFDHTSQTTAYSRAEATVANTEYQMEYTSGNYVSGTTCGTPTVFQLTAGGNADFTSDSGGDWTGGPVYLPTTVGTYTECGVDTADTTLGTNHKLFTIT